MLEVLKSIFKFQTFKPSFHTAEKSKNELSSTTLLSRCGLLTLFAKIISSRLTKNFLSFVLRYEIIIVSDKTDTHNQYPDTTIAPKKFP